MAGFVALYSGSRIDNAKLLAVSCDPDTVRRFAAELLDSPLYSQDTDADPVSNALNSGKRQALRLVCEQEDDR